MEEIIEDFIFLGLDSSLNLLFFYKRKFVSYTCIIFHAVRLKSIDFLVSKLLFLKTELFYAVFLCERI
jgi:hypothetical protein